MNKYNSLHYSRATLKVAITNLAKSLLWDLSVYLLASVAKRLDNTYPLGISLFLFLVRRSKTPSILRRKNPKIHTTPPDKCNLNSYYYNKNNNKYQQDSMNISEDITIKANIKQKLNIF